MSRRRQTGVPISLFSFQDIITCVSGIIIIIVLMLALELVQRQEGGKATASEAELSQVEADLTETRAELEKRTSDWQRSEAILRELAGASPVDLNRQVELVRVEIERLRREAEEAKLDVRRLDAERRGAETRRSESKETVKQLQDLTRRQQELKDLIERERRENRHQYAMPRGTDMRGWLVEVDATTIAAAPLGRAAKPTVFSGDRAGRPVEAFMNWAGAQPKSTAYFLLIVRPGGVERFNDLESRLASAGFRFGFDLAGPQQTVLDPERGAGE